MESFSRSCSVQPARTEGASLGDHTGPLSSGMPDSTIRRPCPRTVIDRATAPSLCLGSILKSHVGPKHRPCFSLSALLLALASERHCLRVVTPRDGVCKSGGASAECGSQGCIRGQHSHKARCRRGSCKAGGESWAPSGQRCGTGQVAAALCGIPRPPAVLGGACSRGAQCA